MSLLARVARILRGRRESAAPTLAEREQRARETREQIEREKAAQLHKRGPKGF